MNDVATQLKLILPRKPQEVDIATVRRQQTMTGAINLCATMGAFVNDKDLCRSLDIDPATWARIKSGQANFPQDKLIDLMDESGNEVPLIWLADKRGYCLDPLETEMQKRLRESEEARIRAEEKLAYAESLLAGARK